MSARDESASLELSSSEGDLDGLPGDGESADEDDDEMFKDPEQKRQEALLAARMQLNAQRRQKWHEQKAQMREALAAARDRLEQYEMDTSDEKAKAAAKLKRLEAELRKARVALDNAETQTNTLQAEVSRMKMTAGRSSHLRRRHAMSGRGAIGTASDAGMDAAATSSAADENEREMAMQATRKARGWFKEKWKKLKRSKRWRCFTQLWTLWTKFVRIVTLRGSVAHIGRRYGGSVSSFFDFFQKIYIKFALLSFALTIMFGVHVYHLAMDGGRDNIADPLLTSSASGASQLQFEWGKGDMTWGSFVSFIPKLFLPSSFDPGSAVDDDGYDGAGVPQKDNNYLKGERVVAILTLACSVVYVLLATIVMMIGADNEFRAGKVAELSGKSMRFAELAIARWDLSITASAEVQLASVNLVNQMEVLVFESQTQENSSNESTLDKAKKYGLRFLSFVIFFVVIGLTASFLIGVTASKVSIATAATAWGNSLGLGATFTTAMTWAAGGLIVPVALSFANALLPKSVHGIAVLGNWTPQWHMYVKLSCLFLGKIINLGTVIVGYMMLADPYMLRDLETRASISWVLDVLSVLNLTPDVARASFQSKYAPTKLKSCRADAAAVAVFQLVFTTFPIRWLGSLYMPSLKILIMWCSKKKTWLRAPFLLEDVTMTLLYTVMLTLVAFVFMPFSIIFITPMFLLDFLYEWFLVSVRPATFLPPHFFLRARRRIRGAASESGSREAAQCAASARSPPPCSLSLSLARSRSDASASR